MAEYNIVNKTLTINSRSGSGSYTAIGSMYFDVIVTDRDDSVSLAITLKQRLIYSRSGTAINSPSCRLEPVDSSIIADWSLYNSTKGTRLISFINFNPVTQNSNTVSPVINTIGSTQSINVPKEHYSQNLTFQVSTGPLLTLYAQAYTPHTLETKTDNLWVTSSSSTTLTITPKTSFTVTYNANSGSGVPANQTKWYGENLTIQNGPQKTGYTFKGWATSTELAAQGTVAYAAGSTYTGNANLNLYAVWELIHEAPTINAVKVTRCASNGDYKDDGENAKVEFSWTVFRSDLARYYGGSTQPYQSNRVNSSSGCVVTVGTGTAAKTATTTSTKASDTFSVVVGNDSFDPNTNYAVSISLKDAPASPITAMTTTVTGYILPVATFPMDFNANATAVGFFRPAPDDDEGAFFAKKVVTNSGLYFDLINSDQVDTDDYNLTQAIAALDWTSDVMEN